MLPKKKRIPRILFPENIFSGISYSTSHFTICFFPQKIPVRYGVIISKKIEKSAVKRHTLRRQIFSILRDVDAKQIIVRGVCIIYSKKNATHLPYSQIYEELTHLISVLSQKM